MRRALIAIAAAAVLLPASAYAKDSADIAIALGTVLASEEFCGLNCDQAAITQLRGDRIDQHCVERI
jgi:hypothetical protein